MNNIKNYSFLERLLSQRYLMNDSLTKELPTLDGLTIRKTNPLHFESKYDLDQVLLHYET